MLLLFLLQYQPTYRRQVQLLLTLYQKHTYQFPFFLDQLIHSIHQAATTGQNNSIYRYIRDQLRRSRLKYPVNCRQNMRSCICKCFYCLICGDRDRLWKSLDQISSLYNIGDVLRPLIDRSYRYLCFLRSLFSDQKIILLLI